MTAPRPNPWDLGDYPVLARRLEPAAQAVAEAAGDGAGRPALDVAAGDGSVAALLAHSGWRVTATDGSARMVALGRARTATHPAVTWHQADLSAQPVPEASQDLVTSSFGLIFGGDPDACLAEAARVLRPAGRLLLTTWAEGGSMHEMTRRMSRFLPPVPPVGPMSWGSPAFVRERLTGLFTDVEMEARSLDWSFPSARAGRLLLESSSPGHIAACHAAGAAAPAMMDEVEAHLASFAAPDGAVSLAADYWLVRGRRPD